MLCFQDNESHRRVAVMRQGQVTAQLPTRECDRAVQCESWSMIIVCNYFNFTQVDPRQLCRPSPISRRPSLDKRFLSGKTRGQMCVYGTRAQAAVSQLSGRERAGDKVRG